MNIFEQWGIDAQRPYVESLQVEIERLRRRVHFGDATVLAFCLLVAAVQLYNYFVP